MAVLTAGRREHGPPVRGAARDTPLAIKRRRLFWPFVAPSLTFLAVFYIGPLLFGIWTSFHKWDGYSAMEWNGLGSYRTLVDDPFFRTSMLNTFKILVFVGVAVFVLAFALTMVLREMAGRRFVRAVIFFPHIVNAMVFGVLAGFLFNPGGLVNSALSWLGVDDPPKWLGSDNVFLLIMATMVCTSTGFYVAILMAAVDNIPAYLYEDAELAGAGAFRKFWHITLPLSWDVVTVCAVLWTISSVKVFELVLVFGGTFTTSGPPIETWTSALYIYRNAFTGDHIPQFGVVCAAGITSLVLVAVFTALLRRLMRRDPVEF
ncbi:sugar ABC transporter permease [Streptomyces sp. NBC_01186]|uniref:carbohydrate ABC transporter permease n=1 Tax=unclassified Streptomyces TaxID=2593676 RepID=UPI002DD93A1F|nr:MULTISPECIES: sugar ABC transporter permease [unclassified Streptomyces]WSB80254.1 sugar ABC transporter permease [Streptomyces sp. NBC_01775]WSS11536.1 sugar ABC transporter permease [Streptomyces sp. NBC_01186]